MTIQSDYYYGGIGADAAIGGFLGGIMIFYSVFMLLSTAISIIMIIAQWKIFTKNNRPGWYSIIPLLNTWTLFEIVGIKGWWSLVPFANIVYMYIANYKLPLQMGKSNTLAILNIFFPFVVYPILAFAKDKTAQAAMYGTAMNSGMNQQPSVQNGYQPNQPTQQPMMPNGYQQVYPEQQPTIPVQPQPVHQVQNPVPTINQTVGARRCQTCNTELVEQAIFCPNCGSRQS